MNRVPIIVVTAPLAFHKTQMQGIYLSLSPANLSSFLTLLNGYYRLVLAFFFFLSEIKYCEVLVWVRELFCFVVKGGKKFKQKHRRMCA